MKSKKLTDILIKRNKEKRKKNCIICDTTYFGLLGSKYCVDCKKVIVKLNKSWDDKRYSQTEQGKTTRIKARTKYMQSKNGQDRYRFCQSKISEKNAGFYSNYGFGEWLNKREITKGYCSGCNSFVGMENITVDHILPYAKAPKGFVYSLKDIQFICLQCNDKKFTKILDFSLSNPSDAIRKYRMA